MIGVAAGCSGPDCRNRSSIPGIGSEKKDMMIKRKDIKFKFLKRLYERFEVYGKGIGIMLL